MRYRELFGDSGGGDDDAPYDLDGYLTEIDTGMIDTNYMNSRFDKWLTEANINEYGRFDKLIASVDRAKSKVYFEKAEGQTVSVFATNSKASKLLREFLLKGGFDAVK